jgi:hypothetical protein
MVVSVHVGDSCEKGRLFELVATESTESGQVKRENEEKRALYVTVRQ